MQNGAQEVFKIPQHELRIEKWDEKQIHTFVSTHNPRNQDIFEVIRESISILNASSKIKPSLQKSIN